MLIYKPFRWSLSKGAPAKEPVGLEVMKAHALEDAPDSDALLAGYISTAREKIEEITNRALITQTWVWKIDRFPRTTSQLLELPGGTLQSVTSIQYVDGDGNTQAWASSNYIVDTAHEPGRVGLAFGASWPVPRDWDLPITITYVVGYGDHPQDVPETLRTAIQMLASELHQCREGEGQMPEGITALAYPKRIHAFI